jgi:hypothetical protein
MTKRTDDQIMLDLQNIEASLSPENLTCDGECTPAEVRSRKAKLVKRQKELHKELGRVPVGCELWPGW